MQVKLQKKNKSSQIVKEVQTYTAAVGVHKTYPNHSIILYYYTNYKLSERMLTHNIQPNLATK